MSVADPVTKELAQALAGALGIEIKNITAMSLSLRLNAAPSVTVTWLVPKLDIGVLVEELKKFDVVLKGDEL